MKSSQKKRASDNQTPFLIQLHNSNTLFLQTWISTFLYIKISGLFFLFLEKCQKNEMLWLMEGSIGPIGMNPETMGLVLGELLWFNECWSSSGERRL
jgi:hypothetical protein